VVYNVAIQGFFRSCAYGQPQLLLSQVATVLHAAWKITEQYPNLLYVCSRLNGQPLTVMKNVFAMPIS